jgi:hypothetical protein
MPRTCPKHGRDCPTECVFWERVGEARADDWRYTTAEEGWK